MADVLATDGGSLEGDRLPWLEAVEDEDQRQGPSAAKLIGALLIGLLAVAAVIYALFSLSNNSRDDGGQAEMIAAPAGDYKVADSGGGMKVDGEGDAAFAASEGADPAGRINLDAIPETPVAGAQGVAPAEPAKPRETAPAVQTVEAPVPTPRVEPVEAPVVTTPTGGGAVQLGAFSSNAGAQAAWKSMSGRFASLKGLNNSVVAATVGGKTVYRLRAITGSRADASTLCAKLKVAGESCSIV